jgi:UPF0042 nucleotide-binding protein
MNNEHAKLVVVSGLSGSGKSIALDALEDAGYNCIDNLPVSLFEALARDMDKAANPARLTAIGIDARAPCHELEKVPRLIRELRAHGTECEIIFLEADTDILMQRFSETRRRHPLTDGSHDLESAIEQERRLLAPLSDASDLIIDTSRTTLHQLREIIRERVAERGKGELSLMLQSFGFKHGMPRNANFVFDVRCLPNPHWHPELRPLTGKDREVAEFLEESESVGQMFHDLNAFVQRWIPCFEAEGRSYLSIAIGCTGGQHRSVYLVERLRKQFEDQQRTVLCSHRELA